MRGAIEHAWGLKVREAVARAFPEFVEAIGRVRGEEKGLIKFEWRPRPTFIGALAFRPLAEGFDAWVGWSTNGKFPYAQAKNPKIGAHDPADFEHSAAMFLTIVLAKRSGLAFWKFWRPDDALIDNPTEYARQFAQYCLRTDEPAEARRVVELPVEQAVAEIKQFGIPYLHSRIKSLD